tara:strand:+ start:289 stop:1149 length:861 start_codon:yes stop_codon:yes gene_type:complete
MALRLIGLLLLGLFSSKLLSLPNLLSTQTLILLLICFSVVTLVSLIGRYPILPSVRGASVPIGLFVGVLEVFVSMVGSADGSLIERVTAIYIPLTIGIIVSYLLQTFNEIPTDQTNSEQQSGKLWHHLTILVLLFLLTGGYLDITRDDFALMFVFNEYSALFSVSVIALISSSSEFHTESLGQLLAASGGIICIAAAVIGIATYSASVATMDPRSLGPAIHLSFATMYLGSGLIVTAHCLGGGPRTHAELRRRDWHLIESFVFLTLIILPPLTLFEVMDLQSTETS